MCAYISQIVQFVVVAAVFVLCVCLCCKDVPSFSSTSCQDISSFGKSLLLCVCLSILFLFVVAMCMCLLRILQRCPIFWKYILSRCLIFRQELVAMCVCVYTIIFVRVHVCTAIMSYYLAVHLVKMSKNFLFAGFVYYDFPFGKELALKNYAYAGADLGL